MRNRQDQLNEIVRCGKDPSYFIVNYAKIMHPTRGVINFDMYKYQHRVVDAYRKNRYNIILKSRQLGISTLTAIYALWLAFFHKAKEILIIATKLSTAQKFITKIKLALASLPGWMMITKKVSSTKQTIEFSNSSKITAIPTSEDAGRSDALTLLIVDEAAHIEGFDDIWTGLYPTLSTGGMAIVISTPKGVGNLYHTLWSDAIAGQNDFNTVRIDWDEHPDHDQEWYDDNCRQLGNDRKRIAQEILCEFITSGDTFLQPNDLEWMHGNVMDSLRSLESDRNVWIWSEPRSDRSYVIPADVSRGDAHDYSAFHVIDTTSCEIVAEYKGKLPPDRFAELMITVGSMYGNALLCPENNTYGHHTCTHLRTREYKNLFFVRGQRPMTGIPGIDDKIGFTTSGGSRAMILTKLEEMIRNRIFISRSVRLYDELTTFVYRNMKAQSMQDRNDDLVMSLAIGAFIMDNIVGYGKQMTRDAIMLITAMSKSGRTLSNVADQKNIAPLMIGGASVAAARQRPPSIYDERTHGLLDMNWLLK